MHYSIVNAYIDPSVIDNCCFTQSLCMMNASIVNLDVSGNVSFVALRNGPFGVNGGKRCNFQVTKQEISPKKCFFSGEKVVKK